MKAILKRPILGFIFMVLLGLCGRAQEKNEAINVQITKEVDGEVKTYEKSYTSEEEMQQDEELRAFIGKDRHLPYWLPDSGESKSKHYMFDFNDEEGLAHHFRMLHPSDSAVRELELHMRKMNEELADVDIRIREQIDAMGNSDVFAYSFGDMDFDFNFPDSLTREIETHVRKFAKDVDSISKNVKVLRTKKVSIREDVDELGKQARVKEKEKLVLDDLHYFPNPAIHGRFKLKFTTPGEGELAIKIYNMDGKEIFNRYFERFGGLFSETIDLSSQKEGMYLLEIRMEDKRLTRKLVIE